MNQSSFHSQRPLWCSIVGAIAAIALSFFLRSLFDTRLLAEVVLDATTDGSSPENFSFLLKTLEELARPLLFISVSIGQLVVYLAVWRRTEGIRVLRRRPRRPRAQRSRGVRRHLHRRDGRNGRLVRRAPWLRHFLARVRPRDRRLRHRLRPRHPRPRGLGRFDHRRPQRPRPPPLPRQGARPSRSASSRSTSLAPRSSTPARAAPSRALTPANRPLRSPPTRTSTSSPRTSSTRQKST